MRVNRTRGSHRFFIEQSETLKQELTDAQQRLRDAKNAAGLASIEGQRRVVEEQLSALETDKLATDSALASSSVCASARILRTGSVFDPRASSHRSGQRTLTPSERSIS